MFGTVGAMCAALARARDQDEEEGKQTRDLRASHGHSTFDSSRARAHGDQIALHPPPPDARRMAAAAAETACPGSSSTATAWLDDDDNEDAAYTVVDLISSHMDVAALGGLACSCRSMRDALGLLLREAKANVARALEARLRSEHTWFKPGLSKNAALLHKLSVNGEAITGSCALPLFIRFAAVTEVKELKLRNNFLGRLGCKRLANDAARGAMDNLHSLILSNNFIDDEGLELLANSIQRHGFASLRTLNLGNNYFGDRGLKAFCEVLCGASNLGKQLLPHLECLRIAGIENVSDNGIKVLATALLHGGALPALQTLVVPRQHERNTILVSACRGRRIKLI